MEEADRVLTLHRHTQLLSYDTTFQLGTCTSLHSHFNTLTSRKPWISTTFLTQEQQHTETRQEMFKESIKHIPYLNKVDIPPGDRQGESNCESQQLHCCTAETTSLRASVHCLRSMEHRQWASLHIVMMSSNDSIQQPRKIMRRIEEWQRIWDALFEAYYLKEIHSDVSQSIGRWVLEKHNVYIPYSGIRNN